MQQADEELIQTFKQIGADITALDPDDKDSIVRIGAALEEASGQLPDEMPGIAELVMAGLEALQAVYMGTVADPKHLLDATAASVAAIEHYLLSGQDVLMRGAAQVLAEALRGEPGKEEEACTDSDTASDASTTAVTEAALSLDGVAALLVQIEPDDTDELTCISQSLKRLAKAEGSDRVSELLEEAAHTVEGILSGSSPDRDKALRLVGKIIEEAANASEDVAETAAPKPAAVRQETQTAAQTVREAQPAETEADEADTWSASLPADSDAGLMAEFVTECGEYIEGAEAALLTLESDPEDAEAVNTVFRAFHTIKGTSAFLGLTDISEVAHKAENLLSRVRDHEIRCTGGYADLALRSIDMLKALLQSVQDALSGEPMARPEGLAQLISVLKNPEAAGVSSEGGSQPVLKIEDTAPKPEKPLLSEAARSVRTQQQQQQRPTQSEAAMDSSVRVRTDRLDKLIDMVGELVIAQSMVAQDDIVVLGGHHELAKKVTHMGKIVRELQYLSMSMRMVPLKPTFQKMTRLVRDVAKKSGKLVEFVTEGEDTEIDRNMVDIINDPLVHMVRNAVDHGIEAPDAREGAGKDRTGTVVLSAYHSGGNVVVEMRDNGKGLDREKILEKAVSRGLVEPDKALSDSQVYNLIFEPGFSTADKVTDISGRGVGLDVVKRGIEALRGHIDISSEPGKGCTFAMRLPLTLAVTDGMLVRVGEERFIIPTINIQVSFRPEPEALSTVTGRGELVMLRGEPLPISRLHRLFEIEGAAEDPANGLLVIVGDGDTRCALLVDELLGQQHVVAKSLGEGVGKIQGISGGAILGDGRVGLILDTAEIVALAKHMPAGADRRGAILKAVA